MEGWREICDSVLTSPEVATAASRGHALGYGVRDAVSLAVFVRFHLGVTPEGWPHAPLFDDLIEKWVRTIGHHPDAFYALLTMLSGPGQALPPELAISWLHHCISAAGGGEFWREHRNGERTAGLLSELWARDADRIMRDPATRQRYSDLIDRLVGAGERLAHAMQEQLRRRHR
jgi:hypothetical protein